MAKMLGHGIYTLKQAARLTGLPTGRVREWFGRSQLFRGEFEAVGNDRVISFLDLIEVFVAGNLRQQGVSLQTVRKVYARLSEDLQTDHPFCRRELLTDGKNVFSRLQTGAGNEVVYDVLSKQGVFAKIIVPFLNSIEYNADQLAVRWKIGKNVVIDPAVCFGAPIVESVGVPTSVLANAYRANANDAAAVADFYRVQPKDVLAAVHFEGGLAA